MENDYYPLKPFRISDWESIRAMIKQFPLATLFSGEAGSASMTLIPLLLDDNSNEQITLVGHLDRNNDHAQHLTPGAKCSLHFKGVDAYASPDLYPSPQLPGWLYLSVQGQGQVVEEITGNELIDCLQKSTQVFGDHSQTFALEKTDERVHRFLPGILGFRIVMDQVNAIAKLAQDKGREDSLRASRFLLQQNNSQLEPLIERLLGQASWTR